MTATKTKPAVISVERRAWLKDKAREQWNKRQTEDVTNDFTGWFDDVMACHEDTHNILGGSRAEFSVDIGKLSDKALLSMMEASGTVDYRHAFRELAWLVASIDEKIHRELFSERESHWPDWVFSGKVASGTKATKVLSRCVARGRKLFETEPQKIQAYDMFAPKSAYTVAFNRADRYISEIGGIKADVDKFRKESEPLTVAIVAEPHHYLKMGYHENVDTGSCYKSGSEFQTAPFAIALNEKTVMYYVKRGDKIIGRAWGALYKDSAISCNLYPNVDKGLKAMIRGAINRGLCQLFATLWGDGGLSTEKFKTAGASNIIYHNNDGRLHKPSDPNFSPPRFVLHGDGIAIEAEDVGCPDYACEDCGCDIYADDGNYRHLDHGVVCERCLEQDYVYIESDGDYVSECEATYDDIDDVYILTDDAVELIGGKWTHQANANELYDGRFALIEDSIQLEWGPLEGEYAQTGDDALEHRTEDDDTYDDDGELDTEADEYAGEYGWGIRE
jgi:hypothetical protein